MDTILDDVAILNALYTEVQFHFANFHDLAHGWEHIQRVYALALHLAEQEGANRFVVGCAALLHDIGRTISGKQRTGHHAERSVTLSKEILTHYAIPSETQAAILHVIEAHSFSKGVEARTLEALVVRDADRLDGLGAIGIMRWAITGATRQGRQTRSYHPDDPFGAYHPLDDRRYMLDHFFTKLLKLENTLATETGRKMGKQRTAFLHAYLDELRQELAQSMPGGDQVTRPLL